jgi:zinc protease
LRNPAFSSEELEKLKKRRIGSLKRAMESTDSRAAEKLDNLLFSADHPNSGVMLEKLIKDVETVSIEDIKSFYRNYYGPQSMIFVAVGDLEHTQIQETFAKAFSGWTGGIEKAEYPKAGMKTEEGFYVVTMEGKTSTTIRLGQITGLNRKDSDYLPFMLGNRVLGASGFVARLMSTIRDQEGLTYGIYSAHSGDIYSDGYWYISGTFSPELLDKGIASTKRELRKWVEDGITKEEFKNIKTRASGEYLINLETTRGLANQLLSFVQRGFDVGYIDQYPGELERVTLEDVNEILKKYIDPDKVVLVVAGSVDAEGKPLE